MATATNLLTIEEYLRTSYHPDCDYIDGETQKRNMGEFEHARLQNALSSWFFVHEKEWDVYSVTEQRIQVADTRIRIADICLIRVETPLESVTMTPPLLCVEILSPEDRLARVAVVMEDYARMGVKHLWLLDPLDRIAWIYTGEGQFKLATDRLAIPSTPIFVDLPALFTVSARR